MKVKRKSVIKTIFQLIVIGLVQSENDEENWEIQQKNNVSYRVYRGSRFSITDPLRVLSEKTVANMEEMESLSLYHTGIEKIESGTFRHLSKLRSLTIIAGNLNSIDAGIFNGLNITKLELKDCGIKTIAPDAFDNMANLKEVNFDSNRLTTWHPSWFVGTPSLTDIHMNFNLFEEIPANVVEDVSGNRVFSIFLQQNNISKINDYAFNGIKKINILDLSGNKLEFFNGNCLNNLEINELIMNNNRLTCLPEESLTKIFVANSTSLNDNPWKLECLNTMQRWVKMHQKNVIF